jgi:hypothetical protein
VSSMELPTNPSYRAHIEPAAFNDFQRHQYRLTSRDSSDYIYLERKAEDIK